ncbi:hypothetical protein [Campylobacter fetus]|uniref:hypothetical protein n=1 Tax=Campylobacter fetus TaxID=196 RepID=UPI000FCBDC19|nr:hypothetical protein [Campylobacter fetus]RUT51050.1 hypothetical protein BWK67_00585 [Campylobacter fetus]RUT51778.1 hypothetical protein BWK51_00585 [Campylobacter fetus]
MRRICLYIDEAEWGIYDPNEPEYYDKKYIDKERLNKYPFAAIHIKNNKIICFFDIGKITDELLSMAKNDEHMSEICDFEVLSNGYKFTGTFIDALEYIKANFS